jgi:hypothetical protein
MYYTHLFEGRPHHDGSFFHLVEVGRVDSMVQSFRTNYVEI